MSALMKVLRRTATRITTFRRRKTKRRSKSDRLHKNDEVNQSALSMGQLSDTEVDSDTAIQIHVESPSADDSQIADDSAMENEDKCDGNLIKTDTSTNFKKKFMLKKKISEALLKPDLDQCSDPEFCVTIIKIANVKTLSSLKRRIQKSSTEWYQGFLDAGGLEVLLEHVDNLGSRRVQNLSDAMLLLECVACIKNVLNSKPGMEYLIQNSTYTTKLVKGNSNKNAFHKKFKINTLTNWPL